MSFISYLINGISLGSVYAIIALAESFTMDKLPDYKKSQLYTLLYQLLCIIPAYSKV